MTPRGTRSALVAIAAAAAVAFGLGGAGSADGVVAPSGDWLSFGRTPDNLRHSPLTEITPANVANLGRVYTVDFRRVDPDVRNGQQSYPLAIGGTLYVTTANNFVFAVDGATGRVKWQYKPPNYGTFVNFGIAANRGLAYCGGRIFMTTLDMKLVALRPSDGAEVGKIAISQFVPNASADYGYSQTSTAVCANGKLVLGAAGSEYGVRGYVMAFNTDLTPAWPNPYWTIPPELQSWRSRSRIVGGGVVWTPVTIDERTNTVYFGTGSGTPNFFKELHPGPNPRTNALVAVELRTGKQRWWRQLVQNDQWNYDVAQPPLVYDGKVGGQSRRVVSVATKEGVWFAFDARTGQPFHQRVKVLDRVEHPPLRAGQPVNIFPSALGGLNYSPASYDPRTNYIFNAAAETGAVLIQQKLTSTQRRRKLILGDVYLGLANGSFGGVLANWRDHGSISAIDVSTGRRVWKIRTPEPERGGVTTTASGLGFAGGGDGVLRAFDLRTGRVLRTFQTGRQIAAGPTIFSAGGKQYVAIAVGGTPTSSGGGLASQLQVFALDGNRQESAPPPNLPRTLPTPSSRVVTTPAPEAVQMPTRTPAVTASPARIVAAAPSVIRVWDPDSDNVRTVMGRLLVGGKPVSRAVVAVDRYRLAPTDSAGRFSYPLDVTVPRRHLVHVVDASRAQVDGRALTDTERRSVLAATGGFEAGYEISDLNVKPQADGTVLVTGRAAYAGGTAPPSVSRYTYRLSGTITDASGKPVQGAVVVTRTQDRDFWTFSQPSNANGRYTSFFAAADTSSDDPVPLQVQVAVGTVSYSSGIVNNVPFKRLQSATMDIKLPASSRAPLPLPTATSDAGAVYQGTLVGIRGPNGVVKPVSATWPDSAGRFRLVLPASLRGKSLRLWAAPLQTFSTVEARPGGPVAPSTWPAGLSPRLPRDGPQVRISGGRA
jgi:alcohol dehydrogenase (cytochrome c)